MIKNIIFQKFKKGSITYFYSSLFFPNEIRSDIFSLYAFVRTADDFIDGIPQDRTGLSEFYNSYIKAKKGLIQKDPIIDSFVKLSNRCGFKDEWIKSFFNSMKADLTKKEYGSMAELEKYIYGSAEVIGLMMASILRLPQKSYPYAQMLGKSMQFANFIRDIKIDLELGRTYIPSEHLHKFDLKNFKQIKTDSEKKMFVSLIGHECEIYRRWQSEAEKGFRYIPKRLLVPIKTASDMYKWTINKIESDPIFILDGPIKPSKIRVILSAVASFLT